MFWGERKITLYHSTDKESLWLAEADSVLYGHEWLDTPGRNAACNLTTDKRASQDFIVAYRGQGLWTDQQGAPDLFTLIFNLPLSLAKYVGETRLFNCPEYATTLDMPVSHIPDEYLARLHAGTHMVHLAREAAMRAEQAGLLRFYMVPFEYLRRVEPVGYIYKGVQYPPKR